MQEAYGRVIDLIANDAIDFRAIGLSLAKARPDVFLALHDLNANPVVDQRVEMDNEIRKLYSMSQKVAAIKLCREKTGWGLKEAKDYCDAIGCTVPVSPVAVMTSLKAALDDLLGSAATATDAPKEMEEATWA
jgi:ribosomal protein L7/L12